MFKRGGRPGVEEGAGGTGQTKKWRGDARSLGSSITGQRVRRGPGAQLAQAVWPSLRMEAAPGRASAVRRVPKGHSWGLPTTTSPSPVQALPLLC